VRPDGWLDLFIANGGVTIMGTERIGVDPYAQRKQLFHNEGRGKRFRETSHTGGPVFQIDEISRAAAFGDIDNDIARSISSSRTTTGLCGCFATRQAVGGTGSP